MKALKDLLFGVRIDEVAGSTQIPVTSVVLDSRRAEIDSLFVAVKGAQVDGHAFIDRAIELGARSVVCAQIPEVLHPGVTYVGVPAPEVALGVIAAHFYDHPSKTVTLVGTTGTNGKTTTSSLLYALYTAMGYVTGLISTIEIRVGEERFPTLNTTPDALTLQRYLAMMRDRGASYCFMEVSSHGIAQHRIEGLVFAGAVFTNLTHDHLDYHHTFAEYRDTKKKLFDGLTPQAWALVNADDKNGLYMAQNTQAKVRTYALKSMADYRAQILENHFTGLQLQLDGHEFWSPLVGAFNAYNLLAIYAAALQLGSRPEEVLPALSQLGHVPGRFQAFRGPNQVTVVVDYAHTPDALENVLETIQAIRTKNEQLITVVGCGGDRDTAKRPVMAAIAAQNSDRAIFTSDNPRTEDPKAILQAMEAGVPADRSNRYLVIEDRFQAIKTAVAMAAPHDIILIAGKGHETYQEVKGVRAPFDDMAIAQSLLTPNQPTP